MSLTPPQGLEESDFEAIEDAVLETARGRWFLREFARRARAADTSRLYDAVLRIERAMSGHLSASDAPTVDFDDHARALEDRQARLSEIAWMLRERGYDGDICAMIEKEARAVGRLARTLRGGDAPGPEEARQPISPSAEPLRALAPPVEAPTPPEDLPPPPASATVAPARREPPRPWRETAAAALAPIDRMELRDRLALFA